MLRESGFPAHSVPGGLCRLCVSCPSLPRDQLGPVKAWKRPQTFPFTRAVNTGPCLLLLGGVRVAGWCFAINPYDGWAIAWISEEPLKFSPVCKCMSRGEERSIFHAGPIFPISASESRKLEIGDSLVLLSYLMRYLGRDFFFFF